MKKKVKGEKTEATVKVKPKGERTITKHGITWVDRIDERIEEAKIKKVNIPNVYHPSYKLIDDTIEEIKKTSRKVCTNDYAANNVYVFLQNCLKRIALAEK